MEDLVHDLPHPVDFEEREHIGVAMTVPVREFEPHRSYEQLLGNLRRKDFVPRRG
jgi:hypothetical protein